MKVFVASLVRSLLHVIAGALIAKGLISKSDADAWVLASEPVVEGLVLYIIAQSWSFINAANFKKLLARF